MRRASTAFAVFALLGATAPAQDALLSVHPARITLDSATDSHRLVVLRTAASGVTVDVGDDLDVAFEPPGVAALHDGALRPVRAGETTLVVRHQGLEARAQVVVRDARTTPPVSFRNDVVPLLTRAGCNAGACHGAATGKNGFGLTLFGYDPVKDHRALTREYRARRVDRAKPTASLLLSKPTNEVRHKGGRRVEPGSREWKTLHDWIAEGASDDGDGRPALVALTVEPAELVLAGPDQRARIVVTAEYADGSLRDVTDLAIVSTSNATSAKVEDGRVVSGARGEAFVLARFGFLAQVAQVIVLPDAEPWVAPAMDERNEIDALVQRKLRKLHLGQAPACDDATYVRRVFLDLVGQLPMADEAREFVADTAPDKREKLVDRLLERPEFADAWANQWAEVLRIEADQLERKGVHLFTRWLRESFRAGVPLDEIVRRMLTSQGSAFAVPEANFWITSNDPKILAENTAQTFLGIRLQCAQCHNHPFERWTMDDYYGFAAFFGQVGRKRGDDPRDTIVFDAGRGAVRNERTGRMADPRFLGGAEPKIDDGTDRRAVLAAWLTARENPWFAENVANRVWARLFGRGLVDPVDDVRVSNPPSHPALHARLGEMLAESGFDVRALIRTICASATYQAAAASDILPGTYAAMLPRRLSAEQLLDAIGRVTGVPTKFRGLPLGASATRIVGADAQSRFLDLFGRPARETVCTCERRDDPTLNQVLHLINGETVEAKVRSREGRVAEHIRAGVEPDAILEELFLAAYARPPRAEERAHLLQVIADAGEDASAAWEDVQWAVLNSKEFLFQH